MAPTHSTSLWGATTGKHNLPVQAIHAFRMHLKACMHPYWPASAQKNNYIRISAAMHGASHQGLRGNRTQGKAASEAPMHNRLALLCRFDGDGMLHTVRIKKGKASYSNAYVQTSRYKQEKNARRPLSLKVSFSGTGIDCTASRGFPLRHAKQLHCCMLCTSLQARRPDNAHMKTSAYKQEKLTGWLAGLTMPSLLS